ncbi:MAG: hypothetical protein Q4E02_02265 [Lagierella massiliensis]|nr:hypothetical protein [Lagierella massiliensis]
MAKVILMDKSFNNFTNINLHIILFNKKVINAKMIRESLRSFM